METTTQPPVQVHAVVSPRDDTRPTRPSAAAFLLCLVPTAALLGVIGIWNGLYDTLIRCHGRFFEDCRPPVVPKLTDALPVSRDSAKAAAEAAAAALRQAGDLNQRLVWVAALVFLAAGIFVTVALSIYWTWTMLKDRPTAARVLVLVAGAGLATVFWWRGSKAAVDFLPYIQIFTPENLFGPPAGVQPAGMVVTVRQMVLCTHGATFLAVALLAVAAGAALRVPRGTEERRAAEIETSVRTLNQVLYAGAALLIVGAFEYRALFSWAAAFAEMQGYSSKALISSMGEFATGAVGIVYALGLAAVYVPALLILRGRAQQVAAAGAARMSAAAQAPEPSPADWMQAHHLTFTTPRLLGTLLAIFSPLLAQIPIAALLKIVGS